jgi:hypothetical protein
MAKYVWAQDAGHEWLAVKASELINLEIADKISTYSYVKGGTVYLEGDCDASEFIDAYRKKFGKDPETRMGKNWDRWPGRSFARYTLQWLRNRYPHSVLPDSDEYLRKMGS